MALRLENEYSALDTSIRDEPAFVALSEKEQSRVKVVKKKPAVQRRMIQVQSMQMEMTETELKIFKEEEKTRMINILMVKTGHTAKEIQVQYDSFQEMCPEGVLTKRKFITLSREMYGYQAKHLSEAIFNIFDEDKSGHIDFVEYMMAINASKMNSPESKLKWIFNVFDRDSSGSIDGYELEVVLKGLFAMAGIETDDDGIKKCEKEIIGTCDDDGDGEITKDEFVKNGLSSLVIKSML